VGIDEVVHNGRKGKTNAVTIFNHKGHKGFAQGTQRVEYSYFSSLWLCGFYFFNHKGHEGFAQGALWVVLLLCVPCEKTFVSLVVKRSSPPLAAPKFFQEKSPSPFSHSPRYRYLCRRFSGASFLALSLTMVRAGNKPL
jgi:hypothetical protein